VARIILAGARIAIYYLFCDYSCWWFISLAIARLSSKRPEKWDVANFLESHKLKQDDVTGIFFVFDEIRFLFVSRRLRKGRLTTQLKGFHTLIAGGNYVKRISSPKG
jgi:hypothetical protein